jgi:hypothetical protein
MAKKPGYWRCTFGCQQCGIADQGVLVPFMTTGESWESFVDRAARLAALAHCIMTCSMCDSEVVSFNVPGQVADWKGG